MNARTSARQYANALFDVATKSGRTDQIQHDLTQFALLVSSHEELRRAFGERAVPPRAKAALLGALFAYLGDIADEVQRLLLWLADRDRLALLADIEAAFSARVLDARRIVRAEITTTVGLDDGARASLRQALGQAIGREVQMTERIDASIVGGMVAKVGSVVFDGSVTRQIERFREQLLAGR